MDGAPEHPSPGHNDLVSGCPVRRGNFTSLTLRSITLPDLSLLLPLSQLRALDIKLGGTRDLTLLPQIGALSVVK
jgi:hypothetical protein